MKHNAGRTTLIHPVCNHCGAGISPAWTFCGECGAPQSSSKAGSCASRRLAVGLLAGSVASLLLLTLHRMPPPAVPAPADVQAAAPAVTSVIDTTPALRGHGTVSVQQTFIVPANQWVDTGVKMMPGDTVHITASGTWNPWSGVSPDLDATGLDESTVPENSQLARTRAGRLGDRQCQTANWGALVERVGDSTYLTGTDGGRVVSHIPGELYLGINDDNSGKGGADNTGSLTVTLQTTGSTLTQGTVRPVAIPSEKDSPPENNLTPVPLCEPARGA
ncbi:MAG: zinc ribbon domain-containing protein [Chloroflexi bacterium]|nr:zinc ribbon domain-containing protein [Chloroflexota bacterium]